MSMTWTPEERAQQRKEWRDSPRILPEEGEDRAVTNIEGVLHILNHELDLAPSCIEFDWKWEVEELFVATKTGMRRSHTDRDGTMHAVDPAGYRMRTSFIRPDRKTGEKKRGWGGWHDLPLETTESAVVKRAFVAIRDILMHELMESFLWKGARVFDPHNTVRELAAIQGKRYLDTIP